LEGILKQQKEKNARVRKELEVLKQNYKTLKKTKTEYMQGEIRRKSTD
jgi:phage shock protein A